MKTKIERATEIHRTMTPHQMALRIVELQDALELADEAVRAKQQAVPDGWKLVPISPTAEMLKAAAELPLKATRGMHDATCYKVMLAAAPKPVADASYLDVDPK